MKKAAAIIGLFTAIIITLGALFKVQHYPGASIMMIFGISILSSIFIPFYFVVRAIEEKSTIGKIGNVFAIFSLSTFFLGILFKIQHYPGASLMVIMGTFLFVIPTSILLLVAAFKNKKSLNDFLKGVIVLAFTLVWMLFFTTSKFSGNTSSKLLLIDEQLTLTVELTEELTELSLKKVMDADFPTAQKEQLNTLLIKKAEVFTFINETENQIIEFSGGTSHECSKKGHWCTLGNKNVDLPSMILLGKEQKASLLKELLIEYETTFVTTQKLFQVEANNSSIVDLIPNNYQQRNASWETTLFDHSPAFITYPILTAIKAKILVSEHAFYKTILSADTAN